MSSHDPTRRALLAGTALALAGTAAPPASAPAQPVNGSQPAPTSDSPLSARDFGAIGDGQLHPLSERFTSLDEARRTFPFATSLDQTLDWAGIQAAVNAVEGRPDRRVHVPTGRYRLSNSIGLPNFIDFYGDGPGITVLDNETAPLREPQLVNAAPSFLGVAIRMMALHGGTHGLKVSVPNGEIAWLTMEGVACNYQSDKNIECDRLLQSSEFRNCGFSFSPYGVFVGARTTNSVTFFNCNFEQHSEESLHLSSAEVVNFYGGKFEGGGNAPNPSGKERITLSLEDAGTVNFHGVYFEATHEILLKETRSRSGVRFEGCHFTGADLGQGPIPYRFVSDGFVTFGTNEWYAFSEGPARILLAGYNGQKLAAGGNGVETLARSPRQQHSVSANRMVPASGILPLVTVTRPAAPPAATPLLLLLTGELVLHGSVQPRGGAMALLSRRYHVRIVSGDSGLSARIAGASAIDDPGIDVAVRMRSTGEGGIMEAVVRGAAGATLQWSFESLSTTAAGGARLEAEVPPGM